MVRFRSSFFPRYRKELWDIETGFGMVWYGMVKMTNGRVWWKWPNLSIFICVFLIHGATFISDDLVSMETILPLLFPLSSSLVWSKFIRKNLIKNLRIQTNPSLCFSLATFPRLTIASLPSSSLILENHPVEEVNNNWNNPFLESGHLFRAMISCWWKLKFLKISFSVIFNLSH